ncbi:hypothetical protein LIER_30508 [Lithospermum erythrorhizon]|uniref:Reverse transcriptase n=1 Tax=Lithospermum erythrorhizon TaxID=34254 RepID=A0AAV3RRV3_LITER
MGDFNDILEVEEKEGGIERTEDLIRLRLDRVLANASWCFQFSKDVCYHLPMTGADHCPLLIDTEANIEKGRRRFVFDKRWVGKEDCEEVVRNAWAKDVQGSQWFKVSEKIKNVRMALIQWCKGHNFNSLVKIEDIQSKLKIAYEGSSFYREGVMLL